MPIFGKTKYQDVRIDFVKMNGVKYYSAVHLAQALDFNKEYLQRVINELTTDAVEAKRKDLIPKITTVPLTEDGSRMSVAYSEVVLELLFRRYPDRFRHRTMSVSVGEFHKIEFVRTVKDMKPTRYAMGIFGCEGEDEESLVTLVAGHISESEILGIIAGLERLLKQRV